MKIEPDIWALEGRVLLDGQYPPYLALYEKKRPQGAVLLVDIEM